MDDIRKATIYPVPKCLRKVRSDLRLLHLPDALEYLNLNANELILFPDKEDPVFYIAETKDKRYSFLIREPRDPFIDVSPDPDYVATSFNPTKYRQGYSTEDLNPVRMLYVTWVYGGRTERIT